MSVVLSEHLPLLATAPDGIQQLRGLILELAVRGKLVPQNANDEPASELLKRIARERTRIEAEGTCRKSKAMPLVGEDEQPYSLPDGWAWVRLGEIGHDWGQKTPDADFTYVDVSAIDNAKGIIDSPSVVASVDAPSRARKIVRRGTVIYSTVRPYLLNIAIIDRDLIPAPIASTAFAVIHPLAGLSSQYIFWYLRSPVFIRYVESVQTGIAYPAINDGQFFSGVFPLPPLAEQHRIVAKVDELMILCDRLEAEQADAEAAHAKLIDTLLGTLTQSTDAADLAANWQRLTEHFDTLFTTESSVDALRQTILQLAVTGKLVVEGGQQWATQRLDNICSEIVDCPHSTPKWTLSGKICVRTSQFMPGKLDLSSSRYVSESAFAERISRLKPEAGDILYSREGGILGVACRVPPGVEICLGQRMMLIRPGSKVDSAFLELVLNSPIITGLARQKTTGGAAPRVNVATVKAYPIPVPPLTEQHRIVGKVDELMALCDHLKADLAESRRHQERLASTLIESTLNAA